MDKLRSLLFMLYDKTGLYDRLRIQDRLIACHVGFTGKLTQVDEAFAKAHNLKPLDKLTLWMLSPVIPMEKQMRSEIWNESMTRILGDE
jgi:hypothetical protein